MYTVAGQHRSVATWLPPKKLRALRKDPGMHYPPAFAYFFSFRIAFGEL